MIKNWTYKGREITEVPEGYVGFVYLIINKSTGWIYIGKKFFEFNRRKLLTKKEKLLPENRRKKYKMVTTDGMWKDYWGSSKPLLEDVAKYGKENFDRQILHLCTTKTELTYLEVKEQFLYNVLEVDSYNGNILSRFFKTK